MKALIFIFCICVSSVVLAQNNPKAQAVVAEGKLLYKIERASWDGTDLFLEFYEDAANIGGYFSYVDGDSVRCIFYDRKMVPNVIGTISFDTTYQLNSAGADLTARSFTSLEQNLYELRILAEREVSSDTFFKVYKDTRLNLIPLIHNGERKVYILTGPVKSGVVVFGNDYLLHYNKRNRLTSKKALHRNIIFVPYGKQEKDGTEVIGAVHNHQPETGDLITATDICTLMLYSRFAKWETHTVVSEKYLNFWNCRTHELTLMPREEAAEILQQQDQK